MAQAVTERNKTVDVAVSQDDLVALAPVAPLSCAFRRHGLRLLRGPSADPAPLPDASV